GGLHRIGERLPCSQSVRKDVADAIGDLSPAGGSDCKHRFAITCHHRRAHVVKWLLTRAWRVGPAWPWVEARHAVTKNKSQTVDGHLRAERIAVSKGQGDHHSRRIDRVQMDRSPGCPAVGSAGDRLL